MLATLVTAVVDGLRGELVRVEVDVSPGLPICHIVGLPDAALSEARERVRGAIRHSGFDYPMGRITVNLAPADRRKHGAAYDLAIAVGILVASGQIRPGGGPWALLGELSLSGAVEPVAGVLPMVATLVRTGHRRTAVPRANLEEALAAGGSEAVGIDGLDDAARLVAGPRGRRALRASRPAPLSVSTPQPAPTLEGGAPPTSEERATRGVSPTRVAAFGTALEPVDMRDIRGQAAARWALEIAIAGGHDLLLVGPPGAGKTLLARAIPGLLPPLDDGEALEVAVIRSVCGQLVHGEAVGHERPFRAPHHTSSYAALVGGGPRLAPGEVTLAHRGVLFLDELAEFERPVLDALRQPLEEGTIVISRAHGHVRYPARIQLVAAMNPCRCGWHGDTERPCRCPPGDPERYVRRVSGPLLDRIDLRIEMGRVPPAALLSTVDPESSEVVAARISAARRRSLERNAGRLNADLLPSSVLRAARLRATARHRLAELAVDQTLTARGVHRLVRVARTIADLADAPEVDEAAVLAAAGLRDPRAALTGGLAA